MLKKIIEKGFFKGLKQRVGKEKAKEAHKLFVTVLEENKSLATDQPTEFNLVFTSMVLAAYRVLKKYEYRNWEEILRYCLIDRTKKKQQFFMKMYLFFDKQILPNGSASRTNLRIGDRILKVNNSDISQATHLEAVQALLQPSNEVVLLVRHEPQPAGLKVY